MLPAFLLLSVDLVFQTLDGGGAAEGRMRALSCRNRKRPQSNPDLCNPTAAPDASARRRRLPSSIGLNAEIAHLSSAGVRRGAAL